MRPTARQATERENGEMNLIRKGGSARPPGPQPKAERGLASRGARFIGDPARYCATAFNEFCGGGAKPRHPPGLAAPAARL